MSLRRWTEGATYIRQGDHHVGHWPTFLVLSIFFTSPNLSRRRWDVCHTSTHGVALVGWLRGPAVEHIGLWPECFYCPALNKNKKHCTCCISIRPTLLCSTQMP